MVARHFSRIGDPLTAPEIADIASSISGRKVSLSWAYEAVSKKLVLVDYGKGQVITKSRTKAGNLDFCMKFAEDWDKHMQQNAVGPNQLINFDEKLVSFRDRNFSFKRALNADGKHNRHGAKDFRIGSLVSFVSAAGEVVALFWILSPSTIFRTPTLETFLGHFLVST